MTPVRWIGGAAMVAAGFVVGAVLGFVYVISGDLAPETYDDGDDVPPGPYDQFPYARPLPTAIGFGNCVVQSLDEHREAACR